HLQERRKLRVGLARQAVNRPHFPMSLGSLEDVVNHLRRPPETTSLRPTSSAREPNPPPPVALDRRAAILVQSL
ncbi:MAG: hypothetical protein P4L85_22910, partial [Paludisphaera borealis]|nr:hypothetical protein [Paludisphaera borealis]